MIAPCGQRHRAGRAERTVESLDALQALHKVDRIDRSIAVIAYPAKRVRCDMAHAMHPPHQGRHVAQLTRSVPRAGPIRRAAVPGHADDRDVELRGIGLVWQPHECRKAGEAGGPGAVERLGE